MQVFERIGARYRELIKKILMLLVMVAVVFAAYKLAYYVAPFIIAFILASMIEPLIRLFERKTKISRKLAALISLLIMVIVVGTAIGLIASNLVKEIVMAAKTLPDLYEQFSENIDSVIAKGSAIYHWLPSEITDNLGNVISDVSNSLISVLNSLAKGVLATAISIPEALVFIIVTILATYFISSDRKRISNFFIKQFPAAWLNKIESLRRDFFSAFFGYIRAQLIIMSITFTELFIGFTIIGVRYSLLLAFVTGIIDAFPVLGTGTILIPWALYEMIFGTFRTGLFLLILYAIVTVVRQLIEPKILGLQIGVHPLMTLIAMYAGLKVFGFFGLILGPIIFLMLKNIISGIMKDRTVKDLFPGSS